MQRVHEVWLKSQKTPADRWQSVNNFVCTVEVASTDAAFAQAISLGGTVAVPKMPVLPASVPCRSGR